MLVDGATPARQISDSGVGNLVTVADLGEQSAARTRPERGRLVKMCWPAWLSSWLLIVASRFLICFRPRTLSPATNESVIGCWAKARSLAPRRRSGGCAAAGRCCRGVADHSQPLARLVGVSQSALSWSGTGSGCSVISESISLNRPTAPGKARWSVGAQLAGQGGLRATRPRRARTVRRSDGLRCRGPAGRSRARRCAGCRRCRRRRTGRPCFGRAVPATQVLDLVQLITTTVTPAASRASTMSCSAA